MNHSSNSHSYSLVVLQYLPFLVLVVFTCSLTGQGSLSARTVSCRTGLQFLVHIRGHSKSRSVVSFHRLYDVLPRSMVLVNGGIVIKRFCAELVLLVVGLGVLMKRRSQFAGLHLRVGVYVRCILVSTMLRWGCDVQVARLRLLSLDSLTRVCDSLDNRSR